jgi:hypothetical protein
VLEEIHHLANFLLYAFITGDIIEGGVGPIAACLGLGLAHGHDGTHLSTRLSLNEHGHAKEEAKEDEVGKPGGEEGIGVREFHHHLMRPDLFDVSGNGTVRPADRVVVAVLELSCDCTTLVIHIGGFH